MVGLDVVWIFKKNPITISKNQIAYKGGQQNGYNYKLRVFGRKSLKR